MNLSLAEMYSDKRQIAKGAYGQVYDCKIQMCDPSQVAIKEMRLPESASNRSVLHDIFTEITCLEAFRLE